MVEDLLRSVSPRFKNGWDTLLLEKLETLASNQDGDIDDTRIEGGEGLMS
jgi:hypothetical protein